MTLQPLETRTQHLEERIAVLESELMELKQFLGQGRQGQTSGWESVLGAFANCPEFEEMERLGREWRVAQQDSFEEIEG
jgi:hypothetical protein